MKTIFTTDGKPAPDGFKDWLRFVGGRRKLGTHALIDPNVFQFTLETADIGTITIDQITATPQRVELDGRSLKKMGKNDFIAAYVLLNGENGGTQYERESKQRAGDIVLYDGIASHVHVGGSVRFLMFEIPRKRIEDIIGPSRLFTSITISRSLGSASLAVNFLCDLIQKSDQLDAASKHRMSEIGIELIIAAAAERFAYEPKLNLADEITLRRAKAYMCEHLSDCDLTSNEVAAMVGVSLRDLQSSFQRNDQSVADWLWDQRLMKSAKILREPYSHHRLIADIAFSCGFINQAHFATRFKAKYGMTPKEYRQASKIDYSRKGM